MLIGIVIGVILTSIGTLLYQWVELQEEQVESVLSVKSTAITLHRDFHSLKATEARLKLEQIQQQILNEESRLSRSDIHLQHWLDQAHELVIELNRELNERKEEPASRQVTPKYNI